MTSCAFSLTLGLFPLKSPGHSGFRLRSESCASRPITIFLMRAGAHPFSLLFYGQEVEEVREESKTRKKENRCEEKARSEKSRAEKGCEGSSEENHRRREETYFEGAAEADV